MRIALNWINIEKWQGHKISHERHLIWLCLD